jgi:hypothetical protein
VVTMTFFCFSTISFASASRSLALPGCIDCAWLAVSCCAAGIYYLKLWSPSLPFAYCSSCRSRGSR